MDVPSEAPHKVAKGGFNGLKKLPPWGWALIIGGGVLIGLYMRSRKAAANAASASATTASDPNANSNTGYSAPGYVDPSLYGGAYGAGSYPNGTGAPTNPADTGTGLAGATTTGATTTTTTTGDSNTTSGDANTTTTTYAPTDSRSYTSGSAPLWDNLAPAPVIATGGGAPNRPAVHSTPPVSNRGMILAKSSTTHPPRSKWGPHTLAAGGRLSGHGWNF